MARTKQTARKSTLGRAPRKILSMRKEKETIESEYAGITLKNEYDAVLKYLKYMCDAYETFEELIEDEEDPKQLLENLKSIKEYVFQDLQTAFNEMKSIIASPKFFLIQHFDDVRNKIDLECQKYLDNNELKVESKEKAILRQQEMIDEVDSFQKQCLANLKKEQKHQINLEEFEKRLQLQDKDLVMELGKELCCAIHSIKKELFMNQGIVFYSKDNYEKLFDFHYHSCGEEFGSVLFGNLILIEDEFLINSDKFESWPEYMINGFVEEQIEVDYCNEFLAINIMEKSFLTSKYKFGKAVNRVQLNRSKQNVLDCRFFHRDETFVKKWSSDLPGFTKLHLYQIIDETMFQHLVNLEELNFWRLDSAKVYSNTFACNKNLRKLKIESRELTLSSQSFNGLNNLIELNLASNQIAALPGRLFDSCTSLKVLNLSKNKFLKLGTTTFKNLVNLEELDLSFNSTLSIKRPDYSKIFACNKNLRKLNIGGISSKSLNKQSFNGLNLTALILAKCQITDLNEELFDGLVNLNVLDLSGNQIISLPDGIFQNLTNLKDLGLFHNQISELQNNVFDRLVNLEHLNLGWNELTNIPKGLFDNLIDLKWMSLENNKIEFQEDSDPNIFIGLRKLTFLHLDNNQISIFPEGLFKHLICLKFLNLHRNQISIIPDGIFKNLVSLEELGLEDNHIMSLPKEFFKDLVSLESLKLEGNEIETEDGNSLFIDIKNLKPIPEHIQIDLINSSDDLDSTDEMINEQNDPEADLEQGTKKRDRNYQEKVEETLDVHDEESMPKRFKN